MASSRSRSVLLIVAAVVVAIGATVWLTGGSAGPCESDEARLAFVEGQRTIFLSDDHGRCFGQVADDVYFAGSPPQPPSISPDGGLLAFAIRPERFAPGNSAGLVVTAKTGGERLLTTNDEDYEPSWSPDGRFLAFQSDSRRQPAGPPFDLFFVLDVEAGDVAPVSVDILIGDGPPNRAAWLPDGERLIFAPFRAGIWVVDRDGRNLAQIHDGPAGRMNLSPKGDRVAFNTNQTLFVLGTDGADLQELHRAGDRIEHSAWSPDGSRLAFVATDAERRGKDLYVINADGSGLQNLTDDEFDYSRPAWSPDGSRLAFSSNRDSETEAPFADSHIYVMDPDDQSVTRVSTGTARFNSPVWIP